MVRCDQMSERVKQGKAKGQLYNTHDSHKNPQNCNIYVVHLTMNHINVPVFWFFVRVMRIVH